MKKYSDNQINSILERLYAICRVPGRSCTECPFEWDEKIKYEFGYEPDQVVEMCPLDVALMEFRGPATVGHGNKIHPWVRKNIQEIDERLESLRASV